MKKRIRINFISTWGIRCGIAEYSKFLINSMRTIDYLNVRVFPVSNAYIKNPFYYFRLALSTGRDVDIVHIQYHPSFFEISPVLFSYFPLLIMGLKLLSKAKIVITIHELGNRKDPGVKLNILLMRVAQSVIIHSTDLFYELKMYGFSEEKLTRIPHGTLVGFEKNTEECKRNLGYYDKKVLTIFGFIQPNKGHDTFIRAMSYLPENTIVLILGVARSKTSEKYVRTLKELVSSLKLDERVIFMGFVNDEAMSELIGATDIAVFPYRHIEISGALHRILGYKVPSVTSDLSYFKEIQENYDCIEIFKTDNYIDLANTIIKLIENQDYLKHLTRKCEKFIELTNWDLIANRTFGCYLEAVAVHAASIYSDSIQRERISK